MQLQMYQIDAFTRKLFHGNPAAVIPLTQWLDDTAMQNIASENNLSETAFFTGEKGRYKLRWFTPEHEVDLCGHATLATAWVIFKLYDKIPDQLHFYTKSGELIVKRATDGLCMDFPSNPPVAAAVPKDLLSAIAVQPVDVLQGEDFMVVLESQRQVEGIKPDLVLLKRIPLRGVVITSTGDNVDFVSRMFAPKYGIDEDPVTGSSHCSLVPYWSNQLGKTELRAKQLSRRGGDVLCELIGDRVNLTGHCVEYMQAVINI
jgi:PhzF family phenazine biosynthesis protein